MAVVVLTNTSGSPQTWTVPTTLQSGSTITVETWGAASGGSGGSTSFESGGAGGAFTTNTYTLTPNDIANGVSYILSAGSAGTGAANPTAGPDTSWSTNNLNTVQTTDVTSAQVGTPGTIPTNWSLGSLAGLSTSVVGSGIDAATGLPYLDFRFFGTTNSTSFGFGFTAASAPVTASVSWTFSAYVALVAGSETNVTNMQFQSNWLNSGSGFISTSTSDNTPPATSSLTRFSVSATSPALSAFNGTQILFSCNNASAVDVTYRFAAPQVEQAAAASFWKSTPGYTLAKGGGAHTGTAGGVGGAAASCIPSAAAFSGGSGATHAQGGGGGGSAGPDGAGGSTTSATGGTGDNGLTPASSVSNLRGGSGAAAATAPAAGGAPGGGGANASAGGTGSSGGRGQIRITFPDVPPPARGAPFRMGPGPGRGPRPLIPLPLRDYFTVNSNVTTAPDAGSIVLTGLAPSVDETVAPAVGSIAFTGNAPSTLVEGVAPRLPRQLGRGPRPLIPQPWRRDFSSISFAPDAGSIVFNGFAPSVDEIVAPSAGSIVFTGAAPSPDEAVLPSAGSIVFNGNAPTFNPEGVAPRLPRQLGRGPKPLIPQPWRRDFGDINLAPTAGSVVFTGQAPSADETVAPSAGSVLFTGQAPSVDEAVQPGAGSIVFTGNAPSPFVEGISPRLPRQLGRGPRPLIAHPLRDFSTADVTLSPDAGSVAFIGQTPSVDEALLPGAGSVVLTGQAPSADLFLPPGAGSIVFTGLAPTPIYNVATAPGVGSMLFTGRVPVVTASAPRLLVAQPQFLW